MQIKKICCKCKEEKPVDMFYKDRIKKDGVRPYCKPCESHKHKDYYLNNKDNIKWGSQQWRLKNKERLKEYSKKTHSRIVKNLEDVYVKHSLTTGNSLSHKDIPKWLIEAKRQEMKLKRILKKGDKDERQKTSK